MTTVVVSGALANRCFNGGGAWVRLNWILGLKRLGFNVYFVEEIRRETCVDSAGAVAPFADSVNLDFFQLVMEQFDLSNSATLIYEHGKESYGQPYSELLDLAGTADFLINISGHLTSESLFRRFRRKVYVDLDPGFTQIWQAAGNNGAHLAGHDWYFTVGANLGTAGCPIPIGDRRWHAIRPPVVLEHWPVVRATAADRFTTVASWRGPYGPVQLNGKTLGIKVHEFRKFLGVPMRTRQTFEVALNIHPADGKDRNALQRHGWNIVDPRVAVPDPASFRGYVQASAAEFSVAQGVYVDSNSGWFSDRTAAYLASGKPALVQDTGFSRNYPVGEGLLAFRTVEEAVAGAQRIRKDYDQHCRAARALAEEFFDSDIVLSRLATQVGIAP